MDGYTKQQYLNLFTHPLRRNEYISSFNLNKDNFRKKEYWLNDNIVYKHLDEEMLVGQFLPKNNDGKTWTDRIIIDLDRPEEQFIPMIKVMAEAGQKYPSLLFRSSESGHLHAYYLLNKNIKGSNIEILQTYFNTVSKDQNIKRIEVYPQPKHGIRIPLGTGGKWLKTTSGEVLTNSKTEAINEIYTSWTDLPKMDTYSLIGKLYQFAEETTVNNGLNTNKDRNIIISKPGKLWIKEKQLREQGLTDYGQRNDATLWLSAANFNKGLTLLESINNIKDWSREIQNAANSKDIQKAITTGNWKQIESEITSHYKRYERTFDQAKRSKGGKIDAVASLTDPERLNAHQIAASLTGNTKRRHRQKKSEYERILNAISFIWIQSRNRSEGGFGWKSPESFQVARISKSLFERARIYRRSNGFDPVKRLIQAGLIEVHLKGYGSPNAPGRATVYKLNFSLINVERPKNIKPLSILSKEERERADLSASLGVLVNNKEITDTPIVKQLKNNNQRNKSSNGNWTKSSNKKERSNLANTDVSFSYSDKTSSLIKRIGDKLTKTGDEL